MFSPSALRICTVALTAALLVMMSSGEGIAAGNAGDSFDGAVWRYGMTSKKTRGATLKGSFRVSDDVLYQKDTRDDPDYSKKVGRNHPNGKKTRIDFDDLRGINENKKIQAGIKGTARLSMDEAGKWSGTFIDGDGVHWDFQCSRIQE